MTRSAITLQRHTASSFELPPDLLETIAEQAERREREDAQGKRRARAKRLCGLAVLAVDTLRQGPPKLAAEVEGAIHDVAAGVEALATFELAVRRYQEPSPEQRQAAGRVIEHTALGWALDKVEKLVQAHERAEAERRRR